MGEHSDTTAQRFRRVGHVALADLRQRLRSRRLLVVFAVVAYLGYLVNVGTIELNYYLADGTVVAGAPTAALVGLKAALTSTTVVFLGGYYLLTGTLVRDHETGISQLVATTPATDTEIVLGKWLSHVGTVAVLLTTLGAATVINHVAAGVGPTNPLALLPPIFLFGLPLGGLVAGIAVLFESTDTLDGSLGSVGYFLFAAVAFAALLPAAGSGGVPLTVRLGDFVGLSAVGQLTQPAILEVAPDYPGGIPSFGSLRRAPAAQFQYTGQPIPGWLFLQRLGFLLLGGLLAVAASLPYDRWSDLGSDSGTGRGFVGRLVWLVTLGGRLPFVGGGHETDETTANATGETRVTGGGDTDPVGGTGDTGPVDSAGDTTSADGTGDTASADGTGRTASTSEAGGTADRSQSAESVSLTSVDSRSGGGFRRLLAAEAKLTLRGQRWWWYLGAVALALTPLWPSGAGSAAVIAATAWPVFLWSSTGVRIHRHETAALIHSSGAALRQLLAEWLVAVLVGLVVVAPSILSAGVTTTTLAAVAGAVVFPPGLAVAFGLLGGSSRPFEFVYLVVWYAGPLNRVPTLDFAGVSEAAAAANTPLLFAALGLVGLAVAVAARFRAASPRAERGILR